MNRILKQFALFVCVATGHTAYSLAFPHTIIFENKTKQTKNLSVDALTVLNTVDIQTHRTHNLVLKPEDTETLVESGEIYKELKLNNTLWINLKDRGPIVKIELRDNNKVAIRTIRPFSYFAHAQLKAAAAKKAVFEKFAQTSAGAWLSNMWQSLKAKLARIFPSTPITVAKPAPLEEELLDLPEPGITIQTANVTATDQAWQLFPAANALRLSYLSTQHTPYPDEEKRISRLVLNLPDNASSKQIAQSFRTMSAPYHPDKFKYLTDAEKAELPETIREAAFQILSQAFATLK